MIIDEFKSLNSGDKLQKYKEFNDPSNIFTKDVDLINFLDTGTEEMEDTIRSEVAAQKYAENINQESNQALAPLNDGTTLDITSTATSRDYTPIATEANKQPFLNKNIPLMNLGKYAADKTAQAVISEIDNSNYDSADKKYLKFLGARESDFRMNAGKGQYKGLYQFNRDSLGAVGIKMDDYLGNTVVQHQAALKYRDKNLNQLKDYQKYIGTVKDGVLVTKNGIGAMAHLLGAATVKDYFDGTKKTKLAQNGFKDGNGTTIQEYMRLFS